MMKPVITALLCVSIISGSAQVESYAPLQKSENQLDDMIATSIDSCISWESMRDGENHDRHIYLCVDAFPFLYPYAKCARFPFYKIKKAREITLFSMYEKNIKGYLRGVDAYFVELSVHGEEISVLVNVRKVDAVRIDKRTKGIRLGKGYALAFRYGLTDDGQAWILKRSEPIVNSLETDVNALPYNELHYITTSSLDSAISWEENLSKKNSRRLAYRRNICLDGFQYDFPFDKRWKTEKFALFSMYKVPRKIRNRVRKYTKGKENEYGFVQGPVVGHFIEYRLRGGRIDVGVRNSPIGEIKTSVKTHDKVVGYYPLISDWAVFSYEYSKVDSRWILRKTQTGGI